MSYKFGSLEEYFKQCNSEFVELTFQEIEEIIGGKLCESAYKYSGYWYPSKTHTITNAWVNVGYKLNKVCLE
ncbi:MAG: hypothetical protein RR645_01975, partial [Clostridium sp.]